MAQLIHCDAAECTELAAVLLSRIETGDTMAWCDAHYVVTCQAVAEAVAAQEAEATDAEVEARLAALPEPRAFPTPDGSSAEDAADPEPPTRPASGRGRRERDTDATPGPDAAPGPSWTGTEDATAQDD